MPSDAYCDLGKYMVMSTANLRLIRLVISWQTVGRTAHLDDLFLGLFHGLFLGLFLI